MSKDPEEVIRAMITSGLSGGRAKTRKRNISLKVSKCKDAEEGVRLAWTRTSNEARDTAAERG